MRWILTSKVVRWVLVLSLFVSVIWLARAFVDYWLAHQIAIDSGNCRGQLKWVTLGVENYVDRYGGMPAAVYRDGEIPIEQSWRLADTRVVEPSLVLDYDPASPWDSSQNLAVARRVDEHGIFRVQFFRENRPGFTQILAIRYPGGPWDAPYEPKMKDFPTLVLLPESTVATFEPADISLSELKRVMANRDGQRLPVYYSTLDGQIHELTMNDILRMEKIRAGGPD